MLGGLLYWSEGSNTRSKSDRLLAHPAINTAHEYVVYRKEQIKKGAAGNISTITGIGVDTNAVCPLAVADALPVENVQNSPMVLQDYLGGSQNE